MGNKKSDKLGMNEGTARNVLLRDTLFRFVVNSGHHCFRCGGVLERSNFSLDHMESWLDAENPSATFFDQDNIAFSHLSCNSAAGAKKQRPRKYTPEEARQRARESRQRYEAKKKLLVTA
jgi:hypothetical protein